MSYIGSFYSIALDDEWSNYDGNGCTTSTPIIHITCGGMCVTGIVSFHPDPDNAILCLYTEPILHNLIVIALRGHTALSKFDICFYGCPEYRRGRYYPSDKLIYALQNAVEHLMSDSEFVVELETALKTIALQEF